MKYVITRNENGTEFYTLHSALEMSQDQASQQVTDRTRR